MQEKTDLIRVSLCVRRRVRQPSHFLSFGPGSGTQSRRAWRRERPGVEHLPTATRRRSRYRGLLAGGQPTGTAGASHSIMQGEIFTAVVTEECCQAQQPAGGTMKMRIAIARVLPAGGTRLVVLLRDA